MIELRIDPEFKSIIPSLTEEEFKQLEENILAEGAIYSAIIVWGDLIVDGHNRYEIAKKHGIDVITYPKKFDNRYEVIAWICKNQLGRRNLSDFQKTLLIGRRMEAEKHTNGAIDGFRGNQHTNLVLGHSDPVPDSMYTADRIAHESGVSTATVKRAARVVRGMEAAEAVSPGISQEITSGAIEVTNKELIAIGHAPPEVRQQMVADLRKPKSSSKDQNKKKSLPDSDIEDIEEISENKDAEQSAEAGVTEKDVLVSMKCAVDSMISTCENYFSRFPKLLTEYKPESIAVFDGITEFIMRIEGDTYHDRELQD